MQPVYLDEAGIARFKENKIVKVLLDMGPLDMNKLAVLPFTQEDREQFAQLIGYSVSGFGELSYASSGAVKRADMKADIMTAQSKSEVTTNGAIKRKG